MPESSVLIVTGESSGELYGALLARQIRNLYPDVQIFGVGGVKMKEAGVTVFADIASALGAFEVISSLKKIKETFNKTIEVIKNVRPQVIVLIDYPDFNLRVAKEAKTLGIKILYYVSPQVWAWRKGRVKTIARLVDKIAVLLPFEKQIYDEVGLPCEFVGHPIIEEIPCLTKQQAREKLSVSADGRLIALLPGSRPAELRRHLPVLLEFIRKLRRERFFRKSDGFILPLAPNLRRTDNELFSALESEGVKITDGLASEVLLASDAAVIASGTASFQSALIGTPMVVFYRLNPISYLIGRLIIDVKYITLVNLILNKPVVCELIQSAANAENILSEIKRILNDEDYKCGMIKEFKTVRSIYEGLRPSKRVAEIVAEMAGFE